MPAVPQGRPHPKRKGSIRVGPPTPSKLAKAFAEHLMSRLGEADLIRRMDGHEGQPPVHFFVYRNLPSPGKTTYVTFGLCLGNHLEWRYAKPELVLTVDSDEEDWGIAAAYFVRELRGELPFHPGTLLTLEEPIANGSEMTGFVVCAQDVFKGLDAAIMVGTTCIQFIGLCPIYTEETAVIQDEGIERFVEKLQDPHNPIRPPVEPDED